MTVYRFVIEGAARTLKNNPQIFLLKSFGKGQPCPHCKKPLVATRLASKAWEEWVKTARIFTGKREHWADNHGKKWSEYSHELKRAKIGKDLVTYAVPSNGQPGIKLQPLAVPLNCEALFYREARRGDSVGYVQGLYDLMQEWGIVADDKWITQGDGTRMLIDRARPRVEVTLRVLPAIEVEPEQLAVGLPDEDDEVVTATKAEKPPWA